MAGVFHCGLPGAILPILGSPKNFSQVVRKRLVVFVLNSAGVPINVAYGDAATIAAKLSTGCTVVTFPGNWAVNNVPATAVQATITQAAGAATVRHVCTTISAALSTAATAQAVAAVLVLRDGATGAGTVLWSKQVILPANQVWSVDLTGLDIVGSAATAMTLEFTAAGVAGSFESVSLCGYDAA